jgi:hypothetical protein
MQQDLAVFCFTYAMSFARADRPSNLSGTVGNPCTYSDPCALMHPTAGIRLAWSLEWALCSLGGRVEHFIHEHEHRLDVTNLVR